ncbi:cob(I)yrinic acid a,c-diamide adenosyltransferase [Thiotrichales bacterium 19S3-7]|nr:cob(I)yrinic acid a,c-diamide adenosyltransferase [Thiotrichales bacterium 19S3-7]MCF6801584.1 cob(I)yrinic acid a,c-diamide adenosyltransferase [Thiotrichales bacterium 19S3-11]
MGQRLSKIYTKTGDKKQTKTATNQVLIKDHPKIILNGELDELNSCLGLVRSFLQNDIALFDEILQTLQHQLFDFGGEITLPTYPKITSKAIAYLEDNIDKINAKLPPLKEFILPGGNQCASFCHLARAVARRCERHLISLSRTEKLSEYLLIYINRLSDLLFVLARYLNVSANSQEIYWNSQKLLKG